jgi:hypothetical protein
MGAGKWWKNVKGNLETQDHVDNKEVLLITTRANTEIS